MADIFSVPEGIELTNEDEDVVVRIVPTDIDPSSVGLDEPIGTLAIQNNGNIFQKFDTGLTDWKRKLDTDDTLSGGSSDVPFFKVNSGQTKTIPENIENGVHFRLTNSGKIVNNGRMLVRC